MHLGKGHSTAEVLVAGSSQAGQHLPVQLAERLGKKAAVECAWVLAVQRAQTMEMTA